MNIRNRIARSGDDLMLSRLLKNWTKKSDIPASAKERLLIAIFKENNRKMVNETIFNSQKQINYSLDINFMIFARATAYALQTSIPVL